MISIEYTHRIVRSISMSAIWHCSSGPKIINPIQGRFLCQYIVPRKNQQHLICILQVSLRFLKKLTLVRRLSAISLRVKAATASELSSVSFFMPYSCTFAWTNSANWIVSPDSPEKRSRLCWFNVRDLSSVWLRTVTPRTVALLVALK